MNKVYIDESGATGNNVDDATQPLFIIASVELGKDEIDSTLDFARKASGTHAPELKAKHMRKRSDSARIFQGVLERVKGRAHVVAYQKTFSVFLKAYDYFLDPLDNDAFGLAMHVNLHRRIAQCLYEEYADGHPSARAIRQAVVEMGYHKRSAALETLVSHPPMLADGTFASLLHILVSEYRDVIMDEFSAMKAADAAKWNLEFTMPGIFWSACYWSKRLGSFKLICDKSKPIADQEELLSAALRAGENGSLVNDEDYHWPPKVTDWCARSSTDEPGLQVADLVAGACNDFLGAGSILPEVLNVIGNRVSVLPVMPGLPLPDPMIPQNDAYQFLARYVRARASR